MTSRRERSYPTCHSSLITAYNVGATLRLRLSGVSMRHLTPIAAILLASCAPAADPPSAEEGDPLIELLAETNGKVEQFQYSPDGGQIAYVSAKNGSYDIWLMRADGADAHALTDLYPEQERDPQWSPDGRWISYVSRGDIFLLPVDGSSPPINISYGWGGTSARWTPDGRSLVFVRGGPNGHDQIATLPADYPVGPVGVEYLTSGPYTNKDPRISPDGEWIAFASDRSGYNDWKRMDIWIMPRSGGEATLLTPGTEESHESSPKWSPDGTRIAFVSNRSGWRNVGVVDVKNLRTRMLTSSEWDEYNPQWSPDGSEVAFVANKLWNFHLMKVAADGGEPQQLTERNGVSGGFEGLQARGTFRWSPDGQSIAHTYMGPKTTSDLWVIGADGGEPRRLTNHMPAGLDEGAFVVPELISYTSKDGLEVPAFLYKPVRVSPDARPPLLVYARANTHGLHVNGFYPYIQYFVSKGYVVLAPEVRGSAGNGREYEWMNFGDWGGGDIDDIAAGVEHLIADGLVDPERVVMQGGSTGGYFTMQTIVRYPDLLQAAVNFYGPTNLIHMYDYLTRAQKPVLGDVVGGDHGDPMEAPEHWRDRSALFSIDRIQTPLLMLWGDRDYGVRISLADEYYRLAVESGKPTEFLLYNNEPHGWYHWRPESLRDSIAQVGAHYEKHVGQ